MKNKAELDQMVIYQIFPRNHSTAGTLSKIIEDLNRIQELGIDVIQLLPVHPIGAKGRKGTYGSPYAISDYRAISPDLGSIEDLQKLFAEAHKRGIKVIMDMVFNHTGRDSVLLNSHPEWYYRKRNGEFGNKVGDWSDVYDLDHSKPGLDEYLIQEVLGYYVKMGCDGFRFDVASLLPASFYIKAHEYLDALNDDLFFFAEAVDSSFLNWNRSIGVKALSNGELIQAGFDAVYHYASWQWLSEYLESHDLVKLEMYKAAFNVEAAQTPIEGAISRAIENHDRNRIASYGNDKLTEELLRFSFFTKGPAFIYAGEEYGIQEKPELFEKTPINWSKKNAKVHSLIRNLIAKKHETIGLLSSEMLDSSLGILRVKNSYLDHEEIQDFDLSFSNNSFPL